MCKSILLPWESCLSFWSPWKRRWQVTSSFGMLLLKGLNIRQLDRTWFFRGCTYSIIWKSGSPSPKNASKTEAAAPFSVQEDSTACTRGGTVIYQLILFNFCSGWDHSLKGVCGLLPCWPFCMQESGGRAFRVPFTGQGHGACIGGGKLTLCKSPVVAPILPTGLGEDSQGMAIAWLMNTIY